MFWKTLFFLFVYTQEDRNFIREEMIDRISMLLENLGLISFPKALVGKERGP